MTLFSTKTLDPYMPTLRGRDLRTKHYYDYDLKQDSYLEVFLCYV